MRLLGATLGLTFVLALAFSQSASADGIDRTYVVGDEPWPIVIDPLDGRVYVGRSLGPSVLVIDPASGQTRFLPTSGGSPNFLAIDSPHRRLYVSGSHGSVDVYDLSTLMFVSSVPVGGTGIAVDSATRRVYVAGATTLSVIDGATNTVVDSRAALPGHSWVGLEIDPALHHVYVANIFQTESPPVQRGVVVLDDRDLSVITEIQTSLFVRWGLAVDRQTHRIYVAASESLSQSPILAFDGVSLAQVASVVVPGFAGAVAVTPDALYVSAIGQGYHVLEPDTLAVRKSFSTLPLRPLLIAARPDGSLYVGGREFSGPDVVTAISSGNHAPVIQVAELSTGAPNTNTILSFGVAAVDGDFPTPPSDQRDPVTFTYEWARNGVIIAGQTTSTLDLSQPETGERGDTITARVRVSDPQGLTTTAEASAVVVNAAPALTVTLDNTAPRTNDVLGALVNAPDAEGDPVSLTYVWLRNGAPLPGQNSLTLDLGVHGDRGDSITLRVTAMDDHNGVSQADVATTILDSAPTVTLNLSNASPISNEVLLGHAVGSDADGDPIAYWWDFFVNGVGVASVMPHPDMPFDLARPGWGDRGDTLVVRVRPRANSIFGTEASASAVVVNAAPSVAVGLSDETPTTRDVLAATAFGFDADGDELAYTYVWRVNGLVTQTTSSTTSTTDALNLRGLVRQGDVVVCEITVSDNLTAASGSAQATVRNNKH